MRLARLGRVHGLQGFLRAQTRSEASAEALAGLAGTATDVWVTGVGFARVRAWRRHGSLHLVALEGVYTPERARSLTHADVWGPREALTVEPQDAWEMLEGAAVLVDGVAFGRVGEVMPGAQVLVGVRDHHGTLHWLPWGAPYIAWDGQALQVVNPPAGLLVDA